ncbi:SMI1/KNR4 family protein [Variovorax sp. NFACC27]
MKYSNGGTIDVVDHDWELYPITDDSDRRRLARTANDVLQETHRMRGSRKFPVNAVALGANGAGDALVLVGDDRQLGKAVFVWLHETGELVRITDELADLTAT